MSWGWFALLLLSLVAWEVVVWLDRLGFYHRVLDEWKLALAITGIATAVATLVHVVSAI